MPLDPTMIRRKLQGLLAHLWPRLLSYLRSQGWEPWVDKVLGVLPMLSRMLGLNLSLPPQPWQESLPAAAADLLDSLSDEQLTNLVTQAQSWVNWLADPNE